MIESYIVVKANDPEDLCKGVMEYINLGYKPQGGICIAGYSCFYQAMIKVEKNEKLGR